VREFWSSNVKTIFSTEGVNIRDRFTCWHEVACQHVIHHQSRPACRHTFEAHLKAEQVADIELLSAEVSPMAFTHTKTQASSADYRKVIICRPMSGRLILEQDGRSAPLQAGQLALVDPQRPYIGSFDRDSILLIAKVPRLGLEARLGSLRMVTAHVVNTHEPAGHFASSFLGMLTRYAGAMESRLEHIVRDQVVELLAASLAKVLEEPGRAVSTSIVLTRLRVRSAVEAALPDPNADPAGIAARAGVSVRYANQVLAADRTSIMRLVLSRRLDRCRAAFDDPSQGPRTISEIAYAWGFSDMTHFARAFSRAFGVLPRDYRQSARAARLQAA
jgi:AraC family transcriptional activator of tynA and feaB